MGIKMLSARLNTAHLRTAGLSRHQNNCKWTRRTFVLRVRADQSVSWFDKGVSSSTVGLHYDAVIVLAGGLTPKGGLPKWVTRRLDAAADIYHLQSRACPVLCLGGGTPHKPVVLGATGHALHEATVCAEYLQGRGLPAQDILKEVSSYDTVGNGYFALTIHAIPAAWRRCSVVTSSFHMPRSRAIFETCFTLGGQSLYDAREHFSLDFHAVLDDKAFAPDVLRARQLKEQQSLETWREDTAKFTRLQDLHAWLHSTHLCYSVLRQGGFGVKDPLGRGMTEEVLASY